MKKMLKIVDVIFYSSLAVLIIIISVVAYYEVQQADVQNAYFNKVHENLERTARYNPIEGKQSLSSARRKVKFNSWMRIEGNESKGKHLPPEIEKIIDTTCFNKDGTILGSFGEKSIYPNNCERIAYISSGKETGNIAMKFVFSWMTISLVLYAIYDHVYKWIGSRPKKLTTNSSH